jgi:hypothetical protein
MNVSVFKVFRAFCLIFLYKTSLMRKLRTHSKACSFTSPTCFGTSVPHSGVHTSNLKLAGILQHSAAKLGSGWLMYTHIIKVLHVLIFPVDGRYIKNKIMAGGYKFHVHNIVAAFVCIYNHLE